MLRSEVPALFGQKAPPLSPDPQFFSALNSRHEGDPLFGNCSIRQQSAAPTFWCFSPVPWRRTSELPSIGKLGGRSSYTLPWICISFRTDLGKLKTRALIPATAISWQRGDLR